MRPPLGSRTLMTSPAETPAANQPEGESTMSASKVQADQEEGVKQTMPVRTGTPGTLPDHWAGMQAGADIMNKLLQRKLELIDITYDEPGAGPDSPGRTVSLLGRLRDLEVQLEELKRRPGDAPGLSSIASTLGRIADA